MIEDLFRDYMKVTSDPAAAATLVLAHVIDESSPLKQLKHREIPGASPVLSSPLTVAEAAAELRVSETTIYAICESGKLAHQRVGDGRGTIRISRADLNAYQASRPVQRRAATTPGAVQARLDRLRAKPRRSRA